MRKNIVFTLVVPVIFIAMVNAIAGDLSDVKVTFRTITCQGATGFASVNADQVFKIEQIKCEPNSKINKVHQVMIRKTASSTSFDIFTLSGTEAEILMKKVETYQDDKRKSLRDSNRYILENN